MLLVFVSYTLLIAFPLPSNGSVGLLRGMNAVFSGTVIVLYPIWIFVYFFERQKTNASLLKITFKVVVYVLISIITYPTVFVKLIGTLTIPAAFASSSLFYDLLGFTPIAILLVLTELLRKI